MSQIKLTDKANRFLCFDDISCMVNINVSNLLIFSRNRLRLSLPQFLINDKAPKYYTTPYIFFSKGLISQIILLGHILHFHIDNTVQEPIVKIISIIPKNCSLFMLYVLQKL